MDFSIKLSLEAKGIIALIIVGAGIAVAGIVIFKNEEVKNIGYLLIGIGIFIAIIGPILIRVLKKRKII